jgi:hypothetical protein
MMLQAGGSQPTSDRSAGGAAVGGAGVSSGKPGLKSWPRRTLSERAMPIAEMTAIRAIMPSTMSSVFRFAAALPLAAGTAGAAPLSTARTDSADRRASQRGQAAGNVPSAAGATTLLQ